MDTLQTSLVLSSARSTDNVIYKEKKRDLRFFHACLSNIRRSLKIDSNSQERPAHIAYAAHDNGRRSEGSRSNSYGVEELDDSVDLFDGLTAYQRDCDGKPISVVNYTNPQQGNIASIAIENNNTEADAAVYTEPAIYSIIRHAETQATLSGSFSSEPVADLLPRCAPVVDNESHFLTSTLSTNRSKSSFEAERGRSAKNHFLTPEEPISRPDFDNGLAPPALISSLCPAPPFTLKPAQRGSNISTSLPTTASRFDGIQDFNKSTMSASTETIISSFISRGNSNQSPIPSIHSKGIATISINSVLSTEKVPTDRADITVTTKTTYKNIAVSVKEVHSVPLADVFNVPRSTKTTGCWKM